MAAIVPVNLGGVRYMTIAYGMTPSLDQKLSTMEKPGFVDSASSDSNKENEVMNVL